MQQIDLKMVGDAAWPELDPSKNATELEVVELPDDKIKVAFLDNGTTGGKPVVLIRSDHEGKAYVLQFTGRSFQTVAAAFRGKYGVID